MRGVWLAMALGMLGASEDARMREAPRPDPEPPPDPPEPKRPPVLMIGPAGGFSAGGHMVPSSVRDSATALLVEHEKARILGDQLQIEVRPGETVDDVVTRLREEGFSVELVDNVAAPSLHVGVGLDRVSEFHARDLDRHALRNAVTVSPERVVRPVPVTDGKARDARHRQKVRQTEKRRKARELQRAKKAQRKKGRR